MENMSWQMYLVWAGIGIMFVAVIYKVSSHTGAGKALAWIKYLKPGAHHPPAPAAGGHHPAPSPSPEKHGLGTIGKLGITVLLIVTLALIWFWFQSDIFVEPRGTAWILLKGQIEWAKENPLPAIAIGIMVLTALYALWILWKPKKSAHGKGHGTPAAGGHGHDKPGPWKQFLGLLALIVPVCLLLAFGGVFIHALKANQARMDAEDRQIRQQEQIAQADDAVRLCGTEGRRDCECHGNDSPARILGINESARINTKGLHVAPLAPRIGAGSYRQCTTDESECTYGGKLSVGASFLIVNESDGELYYYCKYTKKGAKKPA